jgi:hypothetical protein
MIYDDSIAYCISQGDYSDGALERGMWMHDRPGGSLETSGCSVASLARPVFRASMLVQLWTPQIWRRCGEIMPSHVGNVLIYFI